MNEYVVFVTLLYGVLFILGVAFLKNILDVVRNVGEKLSTLEDSLAEWQDIQNQHDKIPHTEIESDKKHDSDVEDTQKEELFHTGQPNTLEVASYRAQQYVKPEKQPELVQTPGIKPALNETASEVPTEEKVLAVENFMEKAEDKPECELDDEIEDSISDNVLSDVAFEDVKSDTSSKWWDAPKKRHENEFEKRARNIIYKVWMWIIVGDEYRKDSVSMEYAVASTWLLRIAILILVSGVGFFLKYSIQNNWIGETGRVIMSFLFGAVLLGTSLRLMKSRYRVIALGLAGASVAVFYFSCYALGPIYHLQSTPIVFALMIVVTIGACALALRFDSLLMCLLTTVGGYMTPILLSTGGRNLPVLFGYMALIGLGLLWVARYKHWYLVNALSFIFTYAIVGHTMWGYAHEEFRIFIIALTVFFFLFSIIPIHRNIIKRENITLVETCMLLGNICFYGLCSWSLLHKWLAVEGLDLKYRAILTAGIALFYIIQIIFFIVRDIRDKYLLTTLIGLAGFFVTVTLPVLFTKEVLSIAWSLQGLLFMWLAYRMGSNFLRVISYVIYILVFSRIILSLHTSFSGLDAQHYWDAFLSRILNFGTFTASFFCAAWLLSKENKENALISEENDITSLRCPKINPVFVGVATTIVMFIYLHLELAMLAETVYAPMKPGLLSMIWVVAIGYMIIRISSKGGVWEKLAIIFLPLLCIKLIIFDIFNFWGINTVDWIYAGRTYGIEQFSMHMLDLLPFLAVCIVGMFALSRKGLRSYSIFFGTCGVIILFIFSTLELSTGLLYFIPGVRSGGVSVLWAVFALGLLIFGLMKKMKAARYIGLLLFSIVSVKIFFVDLIRLSEVWRYLAFIVLGAVILGAAFLYVRFKDHFTRKTELPEEEKAE